jgi:hypothetical protein
MQGCRRLAQILLYLKAKSRSDYIYWNFQPNIPHSRKNVKYGGKTEEHVDYCGRYYKKLSFFLCLGREFLFNILEISCRCILDKI